MLKGATSAQLAQPADGAAAGGVGTAAGGVGTTAGGVGTAAGGGEELTGLAGGDPPPLTLNVVPPEAPLRENWTSVGMLPTSPSADMRP